MSKTADKPRGRARYVQRTSKSFESDEVLHLFDREKPEAWATCDNPADLEDNR